MLRPARFLAVAYVAAAVLTIQPQSLTRIVAELEPRGLVSRRTDEADRRALLMEITPQGDCVTGAGRARRRCGWRA